MPSASPSSPRGEARTVSDEVYELLKGRIIATQWMPGQRLDPEEMERELALSRTPIQEALRRLAAEGFVEIRPRRGTYVASISQGWAEEAFDVRRTLETYGAELAATHATEAQQRRIYELVTEGRQLLYGPDRHAVVHAYLELDAELHRLIMESAGNRCLLVTWERVFAHVLWARSYFGAAECRLDDIQEGHEAIAVALRARDRAGLRRAMQEHIQYARRLLLDTMDQRLSAVTLIGMQA